MTCDDRGSLKACRKKLFPKIAAATKQNWLKNALDQNANSIFNKLLESDLHAQNNIR